MIRDIIDKNENVNVSTYEMRKLREVIPQCFNEDNTFDMEKFQFLLKGKINIKNEGYGLHFLGKSYARMLASLDTKTVITPDEEHNAKDENKNSENIYITGDNLDALKHLLKSYIRKVKCIYIDPPYNTGKDDFVYKDNFNFTVDELTERLSINEDEAQRILDLTKRGSASHSAWLTFMYPRLLLARDLLTDDGVIFISIDDNEQANLKLLCDGIFGEENFLGTIIQNKLNAKNDTIDIQKNHEYIIVYRKKINFFKGTNILPTLIRQKKKTRIVFKENKRYYYINDAITTRGKGGTLNERPNLGYTVYYNPKTGEKKAIDDYDTTLAKTSNDVHEVYNHCSDLLSKGFIPIIPPKVRGKLGCWTWSLEKFNLELDNIVITGKAPKYVVKKRTFIPEEFVEEINGKLVYASIENVNSRSVIEFSTNEGTNIFKSLMGQEEIFDNPKNLEMIEYILSLCGSNKEGIVVLDFFSGSAHAVMDLNAKDSGNRKYIMVQLAEKIAENKPAYKAGYRTIDEIGRERIIRAAKKIKEKNPGLKADLGFKHYVLNEVNDDIFDTLKQFKLEETLISDNHVLNLFGAKTVLTTWLIYDGYGFCADVNITKLGNYMAYYCQKHLYFIYDNFDDDAMQALIEKYDGDGSFNPENIIVFGYSFSWTQMQMLKDNLQRLKVTDRNIAVNIDIRY